MRHSFHCWRAYPECNWVRCTPETSRIGYNTVPGACAGLFTMQAPVVWRSDRSVSKELIEAVPSVRLRATPDCAANDVYWRFVMRTPRLICLFIARKPAPPRRVKAKTKAGTTWTVSVETSLAQPRKKEFAWKAMQGKHPVSQMAVVLLSPAM